MQFLTGGFDSKHPFTEGDRRPSIIQRYLGPHESRVSLPNGISFCSTALAGCTSVTDGHTERHNRYQARVQGWVREVRTYPCSGLWSLLYACIKQHRCGYHHYLQPEICTVWNLVSKLPHFIAKVWCKGYIFGILSTPIDNPVICLKCKETHLKLHSTSSSDPSLLFFLHTPLGIQTGIQIDHAMVTLIAIDEIAERFQRRRCRLISRPVVL